VIEDGRVLLTRVVPPSRPRGVPFEDPFAAFSEWESAEDDKDFADL
jgi:hypothetical protein